MSREQDGNAGLITNDAAAVENREAKHRAVADGRAERKWMTRRAGFSVLAEGLEASIEPRDGIEEMLLDQLAQTHNAAVRMLGKASIAQSFADMIRFSNASARLMTVFQQGALALHRLRTGNTQVVTVQHVTVGHGGQAVVAQIAPGVSGTAPGKKLNNEPDATRENSPAGLAEKR